MPTRAVDIVLTESSRKWLRLIGGWQMAGGAFSAVVFLDAIRRFPDNRGLALAVFGTGTLLALLSVAAGFALYQQRAQGIMPSLVLQLLQILGLATESMFVQFILGPSVALNLVWGASFQVQAAFRPVLQFHIAPSYPLAPGVAINFLALVCFMKLLFMETRPVPSDPPPTPELPPAEGSGITVVGD